MQIQIKGARVLDPGNIDAVKDVAIKDGRIDAVADPGTLPSDTDARMIETSGKILVPGLIDIHVHLRDPGYEYKETIETGLQAAAKGGFTAICSMPNTKPVNDNSQVTNYIISRGMEAGGAKVYPTGAITAGSRGENLAEIHDMKKAGIVAVTDDGLPVANANMMRRALEYCHGIGIPVFVHAEDLSLVDGGSMNEGPRATFLGIKGIPNAAESVMVARDIALSELTGAHVHFCHISTKESVEAIREAKKRGVQVTCETAPHYFTLTDEDIHDYDTNFKMNPPLRSDKDRQAIMEGLSDGTIDIIASDHAPHSILEKDLEFDRAAFGITGLETSLGLSLKLVQDGILSMEELIKKMSKNPAKMLKLNNDIKEGNAADLTLIDPDDTYSIEAGGFKSKSNNSPFIGTKMTGSVFATIVDGELVYTRDNNL